MNEVSTNTDTGVHTLVGVYPVLLVRMVVLKSLLIPLLYLNAVKY